MRSENVRAGERSRVRDDHTVVPPRPQFERNPASRRTTGHETSAIRSRKPSRPQRETLWASACPTRPPGAWIIRSETYEEGRSAGRIVRGVVTTRLARHGSPNVTRTQNLTSLS